MTDSELVEWVYDRLVEGQGVPTLAAIADRLGCPANEARARVAGLGVGKTVLPDPATGEIWMAGPFAAVATSYRVTSTHAGWYANCAWDMLGIPVITRSSAAIAASCACCNAPMRYHVDPEHGPDAHRGGLVHVLVPARRWYDDIGYT